VSDVAANTLVLSHSLVVYLSHDYIMTGSGDWWLHQMPSTRLTLVQPTPLHRPQDNC